MASGEIWKRGLAPQGWPFFLEIEGEEPVIREVN
jgi:hypothetical protein